MRILVGVDWSDEAFAAVEQIGLLYKPDDVVLVHGVDLGMFQSPIVAGAVNLQGYDEFRKALIDAGHQAVERCRTLLPAETPSIRTLCEVQHPAAFILGHRLYDGRGNFVVLAGDQANLTGNLGIGSGSFRSHGTKHHDRLPERDVIASQEYRFSHRLGVHETAIGTAKVS